MSDEQAENKFIEAFEQEIGRHALAVEIVWGSPRNRYLSSNYLLGVQLIADLGVLVANEATLGIENFDVNTASMIAESMATDIRMGVLVQLRDSDIQRLNS